MDLCISMSLLCIVDFQVYILVHVTSVHCLHFLLVQQRQILLR